MEFEPRDQFEQRQKKLEQIEALGSIHFPASFAGPTRPRRSSEVIRRVDARQSSEADKREVRVAGRIVTYRLMGKAGFAHLQGSGKRIQIYVRKDVSATTDFELFHLLDLGDLIGVAGICSGPRRANFPSGSTK